VQRNVFYAHAVSRDHAPVVLFAYRRPDHLRRALDSLAANSGADQTQVSIYCDGAKSATDRQAVEQVREIARIANDTSKFASVVVIERDHNMGLANSVISGVTETLGGHDRVIVMEDDLVVSPDFLEYMNQALELYANNDEVISIHGFMYSVPPALPQTVFLRGADCWGWATWRRGWELFEPDSQKLLKELDNSPDRALFDFDGAFPYRQMLKDQAAGTIDSWAVRWYASAFLANKLTLYPGQSLVENIGQEGSGTHSESATSHEVMAKGIDLPIQAIEVSESVLARQVISETLKSARPQPSNIIQQIASALSQLWGRSPSNG
jgi:glycosyltransferase involved in cell wall biosynthesis